MTVGWGPSAGYSLSRETLEGRLTVTVSGEALLPHFGIAQLSVEGEVIGRESPLDYAVATYAKLPWIRAGVEYRLDTRAFTPAFSISIVPRRGGLLGQGDVLRIDYRSRDRTVLAGISFSRLFATYRRGRPADEYAKVPRGGVPSAPRGGRSPLLSPQIEFCVRRIEDSMERLDGFLTPHFTPGDDFAKNAAQYRAQIRDEGRSFAGEDATYHAEMVNAFTLAAEGDGELGRAMADRAECLLLNHVVLPFNRLFGQNKRPHRVGGYLRVALREFDAYLDSVASSPGTCARNSGPAGAREVFRRVLAQVDEVALHGRSRWLQRHLFWLHQSRLVWLPLNYGLRPEQYDTQEEWNGILESVSGIRFTNANRIVYLVNEQFHPELKRMIRETESYHVLWLHDLRGRHGKGETDAIGWDLVIDGYLPAFLQALHDVEAGLRTGLPQFMIFLDELYYQENRSREIITFLENPLEEAVPDLKDGEIRRCVTSMQRALASAAAHSPALASLTPREIRDLFRVHVSVTNQYDPAFGADATMRDHRKIAFCDVSEDDPGSGEGIFTGKGVGEHYEGGEWEDRSVLVQGPALLTVKHAAGRMLRGQGVRACDLPLCLRERPVPADYERLCRSLRQQGWRSSVSLAMNDTGHGLKQCTALKAAIYNLAVPGGTLLSFDSLWISEYWASMLIGAALRGVRVYTVTPAPGHAPSSAVPTMILLRETQDLFFRAREFFADEIAGRGGALHTGFYTLDAPVTSFEARVDALREGLRRNPHVPHGPAGQDAILTGLDTVVRAVRRATGSGPCPGIPRAHLPYLHLKAQYYASVPIDDLLSSRGWSWAVRQHWTIRHAQLAGCPAPALVPDGLLLDEPGDDGRTREEVGAEGSAVAGAAHIQSWLIGSQNQDRRSMMLDGEVMVAVSGLDSAVALPDFVFLLATAVWPGNRAAFAEVFPEIEGPGFLKRAVRYLKDQI
ncbi:MAG: hypothetical protein MUE60_08600 [Candidatus Eisenbacteria bacterium]|nr:hypothetical protein [Candidatus Eisenbacteria bacterium]